MSNARGMAEVAYDRLFCCVGAGETEALDAERYDNLNILVRMIEDERERCARVAETFPGSTTWVCDPGQRAGSLDNFRNQIAAAIRKDQ